MMKMRPALLLLALGAPAQGQARIATSHIAPGRYCLHEQVNGNSGRRSFPLGQFHMIVDVQRRAGRFTVNFSNSMPDSQQILEGGGPAALLRTGVMRFRFEDGWGNRGEGSLDRRGRIRLRIVAANPDVFARNIGRNYGEFRVSRAQCRAEDRRSRLGNR